MAEKCGFKGRDWGFWQNWLQDFNPEDSLYTLEHFALGTGRRLAHNFVRRLQQNDLVRVSKISLFTLCFKNQFDSIRLCFIVFSLKQYNRT